MGPQGSSLRRRWPPRLESERWEQGLGCCPRVSPRWIGPEESRMWRTAYRQGLRSTRDVIERSGGGGRSVACGGTFFPWEVTHWLMAWLVALPPPGPPPPKPPPAPETRT